MLQTPVPVHWQHRVIMAAAPLLFVLLVPATAFAQSPITTVEQLSTAAGSGGSYILPAGTIFIDAPIVVTSEMDLKGVGMNESILVVRGARAGFIVMPGASLTLENLWVDGGPVDTPGGADLIQVAGRLIISDSRLAGGRFEAATAKPYGIGSGVYVAGSGVATLLNVAVERNALAAVEVADRGTLELAGSLVRSNVNGVFAEADARVILIRNTIRDNFASGVVIRGATVGLLADNVVSANGKRPDEQSNGSDGAMFGGSAEVTLTGNLFSANPRFALSVYDTASVTAANNRYEGNGGLSEHTQMNHSALLVKDGASYVGEEESFVGNLGGAFELTGNARVAMTNPTLIENGSTANVFVDGASSLVLVDAYVERNQGPVVVWGSSANLEVQRGTFSGSANHGFYFGAGSSVIRGATIVGSGGVAVRVGRDAVATVEDSLFESNWSGIVFLDNSKGQVMNNRVLNSVSNGIVFADASSGSAVGNTVVHLPTEGLGIFVAAGLDVVLEGNQESLP